MIFKKLNAVYEDSIRKITIFTIHLTNEALRKHKNLQSITQNVETFGFS